MGSRRFLLGAGSLAVVVFGTLLCSNASAEPLVPTSPIEPVAAAPSSVDYPACAANLRLRAVQFDPNHDERSFVVLAGSPLRSPPLRRGSRVGAYAIERIERGSAVLSTQTQRCSLRLRAVPVERELRAISVEAVRSGLRARAAITARLEALPKATRSPLVAAR